MCFKCQGVALGYANAQPPRRDKIYQCPIPCGLQREQMPRGCPGEGGGGVWAPLELVIQSMSEKKSFQRKVFIKCIYLFVCLSVYLFTD